MLTIIVGPSGSGKTTGAQRLFVEGLGYHSRILEDLDADELFTVPDWAMEVLAGGRNVVATSSTVVLEDALRAQGVEYELTHPSAFFGEVANMLGVFPDADVDEPWEDVAAAAPEAAAVLHAMGQPLKYPAVFDD